MLTCFHMLILYYHKRDETHNDAYPFSLQKFWGRTLAPLEQKKQRKKGFNDKGGEQEKSVQLRVNRSSNLGILEVASAALSHRGEEPGIAFLQNSLCKAISFETGECFSSYSSNFSSGQARFPCYNPARSSSEPLYMNIQRQLSTFQMQWMVLAPAWWPSRL